jgi:uncharacterized phosphosugar-binding protein
MMVFSVGGTTSVPIEMAMGARTRGLKVVAVTAVEHSLAGPSGHSSGTRLLDHADVVLDLCTPVGDALVRIDGLDTPVGPGSSLAAVALVNELKVRVARELQDRGQMLPVLTSAAVVGPERSRELFDRAYAEYARRVSKTLRSGSNVPEGRPDRERRAS